MLNMPFSQNQLYILVVGLCIRHFQFRVNSDAYTKADFYQQGVISALSVIAA